MANISTGDVHTYINELIEKEFGSCDKGENEDVKSRKTDTKRSKTGRNYPKNRKQKV
jgi:hypothetical protein